MKYNISIYKELKLKLEVRSSIVRTQIYNYYIFYIIKEQVTKYKYFALLKLYNYYVILIQMSKTNNELSNATSIHSD